MTYKLFSLVIVLSIALTASAQARPVSKDKRPNIVVIMTDDQAVTDLKNMPNVKKLLADQGTTFSDAIDSFPLCCPARATFITGQYAHNHGVVGNFYPFGWYGMKDKNNILPAWLQKSGYRTGLVGKWLNGYGSLTGKGEKPAGFDLWRGLLDVSAYDYYNFVMSIDGQTERTWGDSDFAHKLVQFSNIQVVPKEEPAVLAVLKKLTEVFGPAPYTYWGSENPQDYSVDVTGKVFNDLLANEKTQTKPFFMWWAPASPHREDVSTTLMGRKGADPRPAPRYAAKSKTYHLPRPPSFNQDEKSFKKLPINMTRNLKSLTKDQIAQLELDYQGRTGSLLAADDQVAKIVATLKATNQYKNTVFIFTSDNGWLQGQHRVPGDKFLPYEESLRVPFIITGPGIPKNKVIKGQVSNVDFAATILDLANAKAGRVQDGVSLLPTALNIKRRPNRALGIEAPEPLFSSSSMPQNKWDQAYKGIRTDQWKYVIYKISGDEELYDLRKDKYEINNLAANPSYAKIKAQMKAKLAKLNNCKGRACSAVKP
jgi:N-acetylglucosamine-6-sulfatase